MEGAGAANSVVMDTVSKVGNNTVHTTTILLNEKIYRLGKVIMAEHYTSINITGSHQSFGRQAADE